MGFILFLGPDAAPVARQSHDVTSEPSTSCADGFVETSPYRAVSPPRRRIDPGNGSTVPVRQTPPPHGRRSPLHRVPAGRGRGPLDAARPRRGRRPGAPGDGPAGHRRPPGRVPGPPPHLPAAARGPIGQPAGADDALHPGQRAVDRRPARPSRWCPRSASSPATWCCPAGPGCRRCGAPRRSPSCGHAPVITNAMWPITGCRILKEMFHCIFRTNR